MTVTVRFAPSPTGYLHVGGQRTALYNYLFARQHGGKFILRIEDTDQGRYVEGAVENLIASLEAMGLTYDAGPGKEDEFGPYYQSRRLEIYRAELDKLMSSGHAYRCFCSSERLESLRESQLSAGLAPGYDGACRSLSAEESDRRAASEPYTVRLRVPREGNCEFEDIIRGHISMAWSTIDDQILMKSDGFPTYHFANVVDDHAMKITHVIRGEEWLPSLPKHLLLYDLFGWNRPEFAHLPLLLNADRSKLSKRQGDVAVEDYLAKGYLPQALNNFLALLGWNPGTDEEIFSLEELVDRFDLSRVNKSGAVFDRVKLDWMNSRYIQALDDREFLRICRSSVDMAALDEARADIAFLALKTNLNTFSELGDKLQIFLREPSAPTDPEALELLKDERIPLLFTDFLEELEQTGELDSEEFRQIMKRIQKKRKQEGIKGKLLWMPIRLALTGEMHGPELGYLVQYFGKEKCARLLRLRLDSRE